MIKVRVVDSISVIIFCKAFDQYQTRSQRRIPSNFFMLIQNLSTYCSNRSARNRYCSSRIERLYLLVIVQRKLMLISLHQSELIQQAPSSFTYCQLQNWLTTAAEGSLFPLSGEYWALCAEKATNSAALLPPFFFVQTEDICAVCYCYTFIAVMPAYFFQCRIEANCLNCSKYYCLLTASSGAAACPGC